MFVTIFAENLKKKKKKKKKTKKRLNESRKDITRTKFLSSSEAVF